MLNWFRTFRARALVAIAASVAVALALAVALSGARSGVESPIAPASAASPTTPRSAASPTAPASRSVRGLDPRFGVVVRRPASDGGFEVAVRSETDPRAIAILAAGDVEAVAVSPDGRRIAFWTITPERSNRLELWDAARPDASRPILTSPSGELGTGVVWSGDGTGLLLSFESVARIPRGHVSGPPVTSALRTLMLSAAGEAGQLTELARVSAETYRPLAWDRPRGVVGAIETEGLSLPLDYLLIRDGKLLSRTPLENPLTGIRGSIDARWVVSDRVAAPRPLIAWPVDEPARVIELCGPSESLQWSWGWLPRSTTVVMGLGSPLGGSLFLCDIATGQRVPVPGGTLQRSSLQVLPRTDGTAVYFEDEGFVVRVIHIRSGEQEPLPKRGTDRENVIASVILR